MQNVDVDQLMARVRDTLKRGGHLESGPPSNPPVVSIASVELDADLAHLGTVLDPRNVSLTSHRRPIGPVVVAVKRILYKLLTPILERQADYNAIGARLIAHVSDRLRPLEHQLAQVLAQAEALDRCRTEVREAAAELQLVKAAVADAASQLRGEIEAAESRLRAVVAAAESRLHDAMRADQSRLDETMRAQAAATKTRLFDVERKVRRIVHRLDVAPPDAGRSPGEDAGAAGLVPARTGPEIEFDYAGFEERFRGNEEDIKERQRVYLRHFEGCANVLDLGCGRGEFLELLRDKMITASGVDLDLDMVLRCRDKQLEVSQADAFTHLAALADETVGGIFAAQVIEHLPSSRIIELVALCHRKLVPGAPLVVETPNPACLMVFADSFYRDLSHVRPLHSDTLRFLFEATGFHDVQTQFSAPYDPSQRIPCLVIPGMDVEEFNRGIERLNAVLFGFQDYAVAGRKGAVGVGLGS